tara:strand:+ start:100 stop:246 length:147 start_codon:yes stop_codon:yes gene_type:complete
MAITVLMGHSGSSSLLIMIMGKATFVVGGVNGDTSMGLRKIKPNLIKT